MPIRPVIHTRNDPPGMTPTMKRPVKLTLRDFEETGQFAAHSHAWGQVTYALEGVLRVTVRDSTWIVPPFRAVWIPPNTIHHVLTIGKVRMRFLRIHAKRAPIKGAQCEVLEVSPLLRELIKAFSELNAPGVRESLLTDLMLNELKMAARLPMRIVMPSDKRLKSLCEKLIDEPGSRFTLSDWAKRVGASERTLTRLFDREMGITFNQWRQNMRLSHAAPLIAQGMPLSGVAAELGYASQSAFSAMFKKAFGQSPSEFFAERI